MLGVPWLTTNTLVFNEELSPVPRKGPESEPARVTNVWNITGIGLHGLLCPPTLLTSPGLCVDLLGPSWLPHQYHQFVITAWLASQSP